MNDKTAILSRIVGVEEHVVFPELTRRLPEEAVIDRGYLSRDRPYGHGPLLEKMAVAMGDTEGRLEQLDESGITVQVLSYPMAGADLLPPLQACRWAKETNDQIAQRVAAHPSRYAGLAHLPLTDPDGSADELERTITDLGFKGALVSGATNEGDNFGQPVAPHVKAFAILQAFKESELLFVHLEELCIPLAIERRILQEQKRCARVHNAVRICAEVIGRLADHGHATKVLANGLDRSQRTVKQLLVLHRRENLFDEDVFRHAEIRGVVEHIVDPP